MALTSRKTAEAPGTRLFVLIELEALALCLSGAVIGLGLAAVAFRRSDTWQGQ